MRNRVRKITPNLAAICRRRVPNVRVEILEKIDSTNSFAATIPVPAGESPRNPVAIFANRQTAGRGRAGRKWASGDLGNIYASFVFFPTIRACEIANWTLWQGASICEMLNKKYGVPAKIKWPNDLFLGGKKLAGMLTDVLADAGHVRKIVFGVGLNVFCEKENFPEEIRSVATSLAAHNSGEPLPDLDVVAADLLECIVAAAEAFFAGKYRERLAELWARYDLLRDKVVTAIYGNEKFSGVATGVDSGGSLKIRLRDGSIRAFSAGDATLAKE